MQLFVVLYALPPANAGTLESQSKATAALPLAFPPGTKWEYSVGIDIIGRVIEVVTGQTLGTVFNERIFDPLGMSETAFSVPTGLQSRFASLYTPLAGDTMDLTQAASGDLTLREVDNATASPFLNPTLHSGGGGLVGTIDDYMLDIFVRLSQHGLHGITDCNRTVEANRYDGYLHIRMPKLSSVGVERLPRTHVSILRVEKSLLSEVFLKPGISLDYSIWQGRSGHPTQRL